MVIGGMNNDVQQFLNGMITLMLAKFVLNDVPHAAGLLGYRSKVFYHVTPKENLTRIMLEGLYEPVHMLTDVVKAHEWLKEVEEYEPAVILKVTLPAEWQIKEDPLHPKGMAVVSKEHIPAKYVSLLSMLVETETLTFIKHGHPRVITMLCNKLYDMGYQVDIGRGGCEALTNAPIDIVLTLVPEWARSAYVVEDWTAKNRK